MPGSMPATSQLDWLSSTTAMIVLFWSRATRDLLRSFGWGIAALHRFMQRRSCHVLAARPIASPAPASALEPHSASSPPLASTGIFAPPMVPNRSCSDPARDLQAADGRAVIADRQWNGRYERVPAILFCNQRDRIILSRRAYSPACRYA